MGFVITANGTFNMWFANLNAIIPEIIINKKDMREQHAV